MNNELVNKLISLTVDKYIKEPEKLKKEIIDIVNSLTNKNIYSSTPLIRNPLDITPNIHDTYPIVTCVTCSDGQCEVKDD